MAVLKKDPTPSAHWYARDGKAMHTVPNADGDGSRNTTLADARKLGLFPSVSGIIGLLAKPGLEKWKREQVAKTALVIKRTKGETDKYLIDRIMDAAFKQVDDAADLGIAIHGDIERYALSLLDPAANKYERNNKTFPYVERVQRWMQAKGIVPVAVEARLVNLEHGFGGTMDLPFRAGRFIGALDYKSTKTDPGEPLSPWPEQVLQLAAYIATYWGEDKLDQCFGGNVYISTTEIGRVEVALYRPAHLRLAWELFKDLCAMWRMFNRYDPRVSPLDQPKFPQAEMVAVTDEYLAAAMAKAQPAALPPPPPPPSFPPPPPNSAPSFPAAPLSGPAVTYLSLLEKATLYFEADGIKFLAPAACSEIHASAAAPSDYAWWYHPEQKVGKVGLRGDAALLEHGWQNAFPAYPVDARQLSQTEKSPKDAPSKAAKDAVKAMVATPSPKPSGAPGKAPDARARLKELEKLPVTFGKFKGDKKVKTLGDLPEAYLDYLRDVKNVPAEVREYIEHPTVAKRIDRYLKNK